MDFHSIGFLEQQVFACEVSFDSAGLFSVGYNFLGFSPDLPFTPITKIYINHVNAQSCTVVVVRSATDETEREIKTIKMKIHNIICMND